jgi:alpha-N-arabinofuranosidase
MRAMKQAAVTVAVAAAGWAAGGAWAADPVRMTVHTDQVVKQIDERVYGQFLEHIFNSVHGGLWGDQILNGTLELRPAPANGRGPAAGRGAAGAAAPRGWEFYGAAGEVASDAEKPFNAAASVKIRHSGDGAAGIRQKNLAFKQGEKYTLSLYVRGKADTAGMVDISDGQTPLFAQAVKVEKEDWAKVEMTFTAGRTVDAATLQIGVQGAGEMNVDQVSLFSASALETGGYRPDLLKAVADLKPATIRWPGGSFANKYVWQNGIGPREARLPHPVEQWGDRDPNQFGTDEFMALCEKIGAEPILVLNTSRGLEDQMAWLEYCLGDASSEWGMERANHVRPAPYKLQTVEIDNETWLLMKEPQYIEIVKTFSAAIRQKYPQLKISVCGSYAYDTGPGEGSPENANWDQRLLDAAAKDFDVLSPHYYNGLLKEHKPDYKEDPRAYEAFLKGRGEMIKKSANPDIQLYVSEWNLTYGPWGNDWRVGLYAGGILNGFERQADLVTLTCPALFMRRIGVTQSWDNALINFDQTGWFAAGNYVVMKLWRDAYAPGLLATDGADRPLNVVATKTQDGAAVYVKVVNPEETAVEGVFTLDGAFPAAAATFQVVAPGKVDAKNSLAQPDVIKPVAGEVKVEGRQVRVTMPAWSAGVIKVTR